MMPLHSAGRLTGLRPVSLPELNAVASLQDRCDRKYIVAPAAVDHVVRAIGTQARILEIDFNRIRWSGTRVGSVCVGSHG